MRGRVLVATAGLAALASACDGETPDNGQDFVIVDSAGVAVAQNRWDEAAVTTWEMTAPPVLRLGSEEAGAPDLFGRVVQATMDGQNALWVVDGLSLELRVFHVPSGEHRFSVGGRGAGPGEFGSVHLLGFDETHAWIWDQRLRRLTTFSLEGELVEVRPLGQDLDLAPRLHSRTANGTFLAELPQLMNQPAAEGMIVQDSIRVWELAADGGDPRLVAQRPGAIWHLGRGGQRQVPFTDGARFASRDRWVILTDPEGVPSLEVLEDGQLVRRIRLDRARSPVTTEALDSLRAITHPMGASEAGERLPVPRLAPAWQDVRIAQDGSILALQNYWLDFWMPDARQVWDVFDREGQYRGLLDLRRGLSLLEVGGEYLVLSESREGTGPGVVVHEVPGWQ